MRVRRLILATGGAIALAKAYSLIVEGALVLDVGIGRSVRSLGPITLEIAARSETVFDVIAKPYLDKTPRALESKLNVLERGTDMVLAEHFTDLGNGRTATTLETVRFDRPHRVSFRLVRGPVPRVTETFEIEPQDAGTTLTYTGEMGTDFWALGSWWANKVAGKWERAVEESLAGIRAEAERRGNKARR